MHTGDCRQICANVKHRKGGGAPVLETGSTKTNYKEDNLSRLGEAWKCTAKEVHHYHSTGQLRRRQTAWASMQPGCSRICRSRT